MKRKQIWNQKKIPGKPEVSEAEMQRVFLGVFGELGFPFLSADLRALEFLEDFESEKVTHFGIQITFGSRRRPGLVAAWRGLLRQIDVPSRTAKFLASSPVATSSDVAPKMESFASASECEFVIGEKDDVLLWEEKTPWPIIYSTFLSQLHATAELTRVGLKSSRKEFRRSRKNLKGINISIADHFSRVMPTRWHYAFSSVGAWSGGATNCQYLSYYATQPQIRRPEKNLNYANMLNYSPAEAKDLNGGGLIAIPLSLATPLLVAQGDMTLLGGIGINEANMANPPKDIKNFANLPSIDHPGFLFDKYYRAPFVARQLDDIGLYGSGNVLRPLY